MKYLFRLAYRTVGGESLWLEIETSGGKREVPMRWADEEHWEVEWEHDGGALRYGYIYKRDGITLQEPQMREWQGDDKTPQNVLFLDDWRSAGTEDRVYEAKVFEVVGGGALAG